MDLAKWGSQRRKSVADTLDVVVAKVTSHLENVFQNLTQQDDSGAGEVVKREMNKGVLTLLL